MGNFTYENQGASTWLVYTLPEEEEIDSMSLGMITNNTIPGLSDAMFMQMNTMRYMKYNVSSRIPVSQFFSGLVNKKRLLGVFEGIVNALLAAEEYMIDTGTILMDLNYIYADVSTCDTVLICLPVMDVEQKKTDAGVFFKEMMFCTQFDQTENCDYVTRIINYLNRTGAFCLTDFRSLIQELREERKTAPVLPEESTRATSQSFGSNLNPGRIPSTPSPSVNSESVPKAPLPSGPVPVSPIPDGRSAVESRIQLPVSGMDTETGDGKKEKGMSLFYLLRHYDKENASIYKAQKEEKKQKKVSKESKKNDKKEKSKKEKGSGFAIPGQMAPPIPPQFSGAPVPPVSVAASTASGTVTGAGFAASNDAGRRVSSAISAPSSVPPAGERGNRRADFGTTVFLNQDDNDSNVTVIMGAGTNTEPQIRPHLIRKKNNERIPIQQNVFRMGRNQDFNDYVIIGNEFVGNTHCHILVKGEEYFIIDDNSKNHTFVNGVMVMPGTEVKLMHGQTITLADEEFEFRLF